MEKNNEVPFKEYISRNKMKKIKAKEAEIKEDNGTFNRYPHTRRFNHRIQNMNDPLPGTSNSRESTNFQYAFVSAPTPINNPWNLSQSEDKTEDICESKRSFRSEVKSPTLSRGATNTNVCDESDNAVEAATCSQKDIKLSENNSTNNRCDKKKNRKKKRYNQKSELSQPVDTIQAFQRPNLNNRHEAFPTTSNRLRSSAPIFTPRFGSVARDQNIPEIKKDEPWPLLNDQQQRGKKKKFVQSKNFINGQSGIVDDSPHGQFHLAPLGINLQYNQRDSKKSQVLDHKSEVRTPTPPHPYENMLDCTSQKMYKNVIYIAAKQMDFYFSHENLSRDEYLRTRMDLHDKVPLDVVSKFRQIAKLDLSSELYTAASLLQNGALMIENEQFFIQASTIGCWHLERPKHEIRKTTMSFNSGSTLADTTVRHTPYTAIGPVNLNVITNYQTLNDEEQDLFHGYQEHQEQNFFHDSQKHRYSRDTMPGDLNTNLFKDEDTSAVNGHAIADQYSPAVIINDVPGENEGFLDTRWLQKQNLLQSNLDFGYANGIQWPNIQNQPFPVPENEQLLNTVGPQAPTDDLFLYGQSMASSFSCRDLTSSAPWTEVARRARNRKDSERSDIPKIENKFMFSAERELESSDDEPSGRQHFFTGFFSTNGKKVCIYIRMF